METPTPLVTLNIVVFNGQKYLRQCLDAIGRQTYREIEVNIFDNCSTDQTREIVRAEYSKFRLIEHPCNIGMWPGQEEALNYSNGKYIVAVSVDILLDEQFIEKAVPIFEADPRLGALQAKIYQYNLADLKAGNPLTKTIIDTCGFRIFRSRRITNIGHGEEDRGQYSQVMEIFGVEGAVPMFRRTALEDIRIQGHIADPDFFWYADDLDIAWRLNLFGWQQLYSPDVIAYHDRSTTKSLRESPFDFIKIRRTIPFFKRALDYRNTILTLIKNDQLTNSIRDLPFILLRQIPLWGYFIIFEPRMALEILSIVKLAPRMVQRRRLIMKKARVSAQAIHRWFA